MRILSKFFDIFHYVHTEIQGKHITISRVRNLVKHIIDLVKAEAELNDDTIEIFCNACCRDANELLILDPINCVPRAYLSGKRRKRGHTEPLTEENFRKHYLGQYREIFQRALEGMRERFDLESLNHVSRLDEIVLTFGNQGLAEIFMLLLTK